MIPTWASFSQQLLVMLYREDSLKIHKMMMPMWANGQQQNGQQRYWWRQNHCWNRTPIFIIDGKGKKESRLPNGLTCGSSRVGEMPACNMSCVLIRNSLFFVTWFCSSDNFSIAPYLSTNVNKSRDNYNLTSAQNRGFFQLFFFSFFKAEFFDTHAPFQPHVSFCFKLCSKHAAFSCS